MPVDNDFGTQDGKRFLLKQRVYRSVDGKQAWVGARAGVSVLVGNAGQYISMDDAYKYKLAAKPKKAAAKKTTKKKASK